MTHRIREAMKKNPAGLLGGGGRIVEADESYFGSENDRTKKRGRGGRAMKQMNKIVALVERDGEVRSYHVADVTGENLKETLKKNIAPDTHVMTDSSPRYNVMKREKPFKQHSQVNHSKGEYVRGIASTNRVENYFSVMKRGLIGTYHHVSSAHLQRYLSEFDFRYNNRSALEISDAQRLDTALKGITGKRLTYRRINAAA
jgi:transposase-like protein